MDNTTINTDKTSLVKKNERFDSFIRPDFKFKRTLHVSIVKYLTKCSSLVQLDLLKGKYTLISVSSYSDRSRHLLFSRENKENSSRSTSHRENKLWLEKQTSFFVTKQSLGRNKEKSGELSDPESWLVSTWRTALTFSTNIFKTKPCRFPLFSSSSSSTPFGGF